MSNPHGNTSLARVTLLKNEKDWDEWICDLVNPELSAEPVLRQPAQRVTVKSVKSTALNILDLNEKEEKLFKYMSELARDDQKEYQDENNALNTFRNQLSQSITHPIYKKLAAEPSLYQIMKALKARLCPTEDDREAEIENKYEALRNGGRSKDVFLSLDSWVEVYYEARKMGVVTKRKVKQHLIDTNRKIDEIYAVSWQDRQANVDFPEMAQAFQRYYRTRSRPQNRDFLPYFQPLQYYNHRHSQSRPSRGRTNPKGRLGRHQRVFAKLFIDPDVKKKVDSRLKNAKIKANVERSLERSKAFQKKKNQSPNSANLAVTEQEDEEDEEECQPTALLTIGSDLASAHSQRSSYYLKNSVVYDTQAYLPVINDRSRFIIMKPLEEDILTGDEKTRVCGRGDAYVWLTNLKGQRYRTILKQ
ncbi:hypothetical protein FQN49_007755, partial [Arthroderma sp. PD_2]